MFMNSITIANWRILKLLDCEMIGQRINFNQSIETSWAQISSAEIHTIKYSR